MSFSTVRTERTALGRKEAAKTCERKRISRAMWGIGGGSVGRRGERGEEAGDRAALALTKRARRALGRSVRRRYALVGRTSWTFLKNNPHVS
jgi:hypothetical protein